MPDHIQIINRVRGGHPGHNRTGLEKADRPAPVVHMNVLGDQLGQTAQLWARRMIVASPAADTRFSSVSAAACNNCTHQVPSRLG